MVLSLQATLPEPNTARAPVGEDGIDEFNIQGDVIIGVSKKFQDFVFLEITKPDVFRKQLKSLIPLITTGHDVLRWRKELLEYLDKCKKEGKTPGLLRCQSVTIGFSASGVRKLGQEPAEIRRPTVFRKSVDVHKEDEFVAGMKSDAGALGDPLKEDNSPDWLSGFLNPIDLVISVAGDSVKTIAEVWADVEKIFNLGTEAASAIQHYRRQGQVRDGKFAKHEHFGFLDGISQPFIKGFNKCEEEYPGQPKADRNTILFGYDDEPAPKWIKDGSFMCYRDLKQLVPEWNDFIARESRRLLTGGTIIALPSEGVNAQGEAAQGHDRTIKDPATWLASRLFGRWPSGAPTQLQPDQDDSVLGGCPKRNNNFDFEGLKTGQAKCPYASHIRKMNPRDDIDHATLVQPRLMLRRGIPYGKDISNEEKLENRTIDDRGLAFTCYMSSIRNGFRIVQNAWANDPNFLTKSLPDELGLKTPPGFDPIIGQTNKKGEQRAMTGIFSDQSKPLALESFVVTQGGEYFFIPSLACLRETLSVA